MPVQARSVVAQVERAHARHLDGQPAGDPVAAGVELVARAVRRRVGAELVPEARSRRRDSSRSQTSRRPVLVAGPGDHHAGIGSIASAPKAATSASAIRACSGCGELRVLVEDRAGAHPGTLEQLDVLGQPREAERLHARLAGAEHLPLAAQLEVDLGELEPVAVLGERAQPRRLLRPEQQAQRLVLAAADPAAELVQLRDPVAIGVLDEHHGRVRDVDADLDHRRGDQHVGAAGGERRHRLLLLARAHLAVQEHDVEVLAARRSAGARTRRSRRAPAAPRTPLRAGRRRTPGGRRAAPRGCARRRASARARWRRRSVVIGRRPAGSSREDGDVEVAVGGQGERARDRRRGHVQDVRSQALPAPCGRARGAG